MPVIQNTPFFGRYRHWGYKLAEVGIDPVKIEIDPSILDRFEIDSIQIMGLERQIDLTLKWS
jgi:hypothetical protein